MPCIGCYSPAHCAQTGCAKPGNPNAVEPSLMPSGYVPGPYERPRMGYRPFTPDLASDHAPLWPSYPGGMP